ncbi:ubiquitin-conjugating enzyme/RWD-like protein [Aspergillus californicus]
MVSKLRRLIADHAALHEELPPNYLFPSEDAQGDDMTQLTTLLAGPQGTPYANGLWRLHLKMPEDYPKSPPKATFKTRIWHPNVEEANGAVCVDTLKRDWKTTLTLKDVLITISCLLIYPNPDSALNSSAGALLQENYDAFSRQAKLMTSIHAAVPSGMRNEVMEAKLRGEEAGMAIPEQEESARILSSRKGMRIQSLTMKKKPTRRDASTPQPPDLENLRPSEPTERHYSDQGQQLISDDENDNPACESKENDPSLSPSPVKLAPPLSPRKNAYGKRPLSVLTASAFIDADLFALESVDSDMDTADGTGPVMTASERNIAANTTTPTRDFQLPERERTRERERERDLSPQRKSPKLSLLNRGINLGRIRERERESTGTDLKIFEDPILDPHCLVSGDGKENENIPSSSHYPLREPATTIETVTSKVPLAPSAESQHLSASKPLLSKPVSDTRKASATVKKEKAKPRIGIRRL